MRTKRVSWAGVEDPYIRPVACTLGTSGLLSLFLASCVYCLCPASLSVPQAWCIELPQLPFAWLYLPIPRSFACLLVCSPSLSCPRPPSRHVRHLVQIVKKLDMLGSRSQHVVVL